MGSIILAKFVSTFFRLNVFLGVSSPSLSEKSRSIIAKLTIRSKGDKKLFTDKIIAL